MRFILALLLCLSTVAHAGLLDGLGGKPTFLPPDQAFGLQVTVEDGRTLRAEFSITPGYYLYRDKIVFSSQDETVKVATVELPKGDMKDDPNFGQTEVFHQPPVAIVRLERAEAGAKTFALKASYMGCSEQGLCYPPIEKSFTLTLPEAAATVPAAPGAAAQPAESESSRIEQLFQGGSFWLIVSFFFGAGLLLAFTPCVFPMIPILSGIIVGRGEKITHAHAFFLSLAYVLGMAVTYALAGVAAGYSGTLISNALQTPWVLGAFALLFVLLALSMFDFYELQLPSVLQSRLTETSNKLHGGHLSGVFAMGALSAIIMGPCVAAPLAGALLYIGQTHDAVLGGVALFALALGMGAPLLAIGTSAGTLLPKAGAWMATVKRFFGVLMLALAIWIVAPVIPLAAQMLAWAALLIFSGIYLRALDALPSNAHGMQRFGKGLGILALLLGAAYLAGALSGATDILHPLGKLGGSSATEAHAGLKFERVKSSAELDARIAQAGGRIVMLDFYADWCVSCKEMERFTFSDPVVQAKLANAVLLQVDVTANSEDDKALLKRFGLFGPPGILFFDAKGVEMSEVRVIGYQDAAQFMETLKLAGI